MALKWLRMEFITDIRRLWHCSRLQPCFIQDWRCPHWKHACLL